MKRYVVSKVADASLTSGWETELARIERENSARKVPGRGAGTVNEVTGEIFRIYPSKNDH